MDEPTRSFYLLNYANALCGADWETVFKSRKYQLVKDDHGFPVLLTQQEADSCIRKTPIVHFDYSEFTGKPNLESLYYGSLKLCPFEVILQYYLKYPPRPLGRQKKQDHAGINKTNS